MSFIWKSPVILCACKCVKEEDDIYIMYKDAVYTCMCVKYTHINRIVKVWDAFTALFNVSLVLCRSINSSSIDHHISTIIPLSIVYHLLLYLLRTTSASVTP